MCLVVFRCVEVCLHVFRCVLVCLTMGKKKSHIAYFYFKLVWFLKKYIKSMTILKNFKKSFI